MKISLIYSYAWILNILASAAPRRSKLPVLRGKHIPEVGMTAPDQPRVTITGEKPIPEVKVEEEIIPDEFKVISEDEVYGKLASQPVHWNVGMLENSIKLNPPPQHELSGEKILNIWRKLCDSTPHEEESYGTEMFIKKLYSLDEYEGKEYQIPSSELVKNLIEAVFLKMEWMMEEEYEDITMYLERISHGMEKSIDKGVSVLNMIYFELHPRLNVDDFESFIKNRIAVEKENAFVFAITSIEAAPYDEHALNYWGSRLGDKLGLSRVYLETVSAFEQDPFEGHCGNVINEFYSIFTRGHVIEKLVKIINVEDRSRLVQATMFFREHFEDNLDNRRSAFDFGGDERRVEEFDPEGINEEAVEAILVEMGILVRRIVYE